MVLDGSNWSLPVFNSVLFLGGGGGILQSPKTKPIWLSKRLFISLFWSRTSRGVKNISSSCLLCLIEPGVSVGELERDGIRGEFLGVLCKGP